MILIMSVVAYLIGAFPVYELINRHKKGIISSYPTQQKLNKDIFIYILFDMFKGGFATALALILAGWFAASIAAILVVFGSMYPLFLGFRGGGGLSVAAGALIILSPLLIMMGIGIYCCSYFATKYSFFSTLLTIISILVLGFFFITHIHVWLVILCIGIMVLFPPNSNRYKWRQDMASIRSGKIKK